ncbi:hypothetical protein CDL15_Pgr022235 [Punica granatum]|uniref:Uncharacterized protein n=1 Tax=Punica granatum TaxID=22663 RepID=A0A218WM93_PUNGR|nr:hypothetical protein CDL15_Pgr022235 [Punica granatum]
MQSTMNRTETTNQFLSLCVFIFPLLGSQKNQRIGEKEPENTHKQREINLSSSNVSIIASREPIENRAPAF